MLAKKMYESGQRGSNLPKSDAIDFD